MNEKKKNTTEESNISHISDDIINWKERSDEWWKSVLTPLQYKVTREKGTEYAGTGHYKDCSDKGVYCCSNCGNKLFRSETKYNSCTGWPSFYDVVDEDAVDLTVDHSHGMTRTEVTCKRCNAHLGHVFDDGPNPTGKRYCMNSVSLWLDKKD